MKSPFKITKIRETGLTDGLNHKTISGKHARSEYIKLRTSPDYKILQYKITKLRKEPLPDVTASSARSSFTLFYANFPHNFLGSFLRVLEPPPRGHTSLPVCPPAFLPGDNRTRGRYPSSFVFHPSFERTKKRGSSWWKGTARERERERDRERGAVGSSVFIVGRIAAGVP